MDGLIRVVPFLFDCPKAIYKGCSISNGSSHLLRVYPVPDILVSGLHVFFFFYCIILFIETSRISKSKQIGNRLIGVRVWLLMDMGSLSGVIHNTVNVRNTPVWCTFT